MSFQITMGPRVRKSPFFANTVAAGVAGYTIYNHMYMPTSYGNFEAEYRRLIEGVAMWDVSCERQIEISGPDAERLVRYLTPRNLGDLTVGVGRYIPMCDHEGRLINDPVLLPLAKDRFWLSIADSDILLWSRAVASEGRFKVKISEPDVSPLAVQGPKAEATVAALLGDWVRDLKYFWFRSYVLDGIPLIVARSGWSKHGGFELYLEDSSKGKELWDKVEDAGAPFGIGPGTPNAVERVESGLLSFGSDNLADSNPFEVGLDKLIDIDRDDAFIGRDALREIAATGPARRLVGIAFDGAPISNNQHPWPARVNGQIAGAVRVACYSPRYPGNIGLALLDSEYTKIGTAVEIEGEEDFYQGHVVPQPLVKPGTPLPNRPVLF